MLILKPSCLPVKVDFSCPYRLLLWQLYGETTLQASNAFPAFRFDCRLTFYFLHFDYIEKFHLFVERNHEIERRDIFHLSFLPAACCHEMVATGFPRFGA